MLCVGELAKIGLMEIDCRHHWIVESPAEGKQVQNGACIRCGEQRTFDNRLLDSRRRPFDIQNQIGYEKRTGSSVDEDYPNRVISRNLNRLELSLEPESDGNA